VYVKVLDGATTVIIDRVVPNSRLQVNEIIGRRDSALGGAGGRVLLAHLSEDALNKVLSSGLARLNDKCVVDKDSYKKSLRHIRELGYAVDDEEMVPGVRAISVPIRNDRGEVIASLSVAGSVLRLTGERLPEVIRQTLDAANEISVELRALGVSRVTEDI
jgi:DNA-binding IclR family transcriptional regulator